MAGGAGTSASRRRQRRLRSWLRHERQTIAMELAAALYHSRDARSNVVHEALQGQKTASSGTRREPLEEVSEPQVTAVTVGYVAAPGPLLVVASLAGGDEVDATTVSFLLRENLRRTKSCAGGEEDGGGVRQEDAGAHWPARPRRAALGC